jgi:hypothetical protein
MIEDTGIVDFCFILVEWLFTPKEYVMVAPLFYARSRQQDCSKGPSDLLAQ